MIKTFPTQQIINSLEFKDTVKEFNDTVKIIESLDEKVRIDLSLLILSRTLQRMKQSARKL